MQQDMALEERDKALDIIEAAKPAQPGSDQPKPIKSVREIRPSDLSTKSYLESEDDVEQFISALRKELLTALTAQNRIRIR
jgi:hypothetical protein